MGELAPMVVKLGRRRAYSSRKSPIPPWNVPAYETSLRASPKIGAMRELRERRSSCIKQGRNVWRGKLRSGSVSFRALPVTCGSNAAVLFEKYYFVAEQILFFSHLHLERNRPNMPRLNGC